MYEKVDKKTILRKSIPNITGIPDSMKAEAEKKSGLPLDSVRVYRNSSLPEKAGAYAYTKGTDVYLGRGNDKYLGHELGHVVQQMQGRVRATSTAGGMPLNDDPALEYEADHFLST